MAVPADTPVTTPEALIEATVGLLQLQLPPPTASSKVVVPPTQAVAVPVIVPASGNGLTVINGVTAITPQLLVTV